MTIPQRKIHSIGTAKLAYGLPRKTIKRYATKAGIGLTFKKNGQDVCYAIDVGKADELFGQGGPVINGGTIERQLRLRRYHLQGLHELGVISPIGGEFIEGHTAFFRHNDVERLIRDLQQHATLVDKTPDGMVSIAKAAAQTTWSIPAIIQHLLRGKLSAALVEGEGVYLGLRVSVGELRANTPRHEETGLSVREAARMLKCTDDVVKKLAEIGAVQARNERRPNSGRWRLSFDVASLEQFQRDYISLWAMCLMLKRNGRQIVALVKQVGAKPEFDPVTVGSRIFRRSAVQELLQV